MWLLYFTLHAPLGETNMKFDHSAGMHTCGPSLRNFHVIRLVSVLMRSKVLKAVKRACIEYHVCLSIHWSWFKSCQRHKLSTSSSTIPLTSFLQRMLRGHGVEMDIESSNAINSCYDARDFKLRRRLCSNSQVYALRARAVQHADWQQRQQRQQEPRCCCSCWIGAAQDVSPL